jgi:hypothetical protein
MKEREIVTYDPENDNIGDKLKAVLGSNNHEKILVFNKASGAFMSEMVSNPVNKPDQSTHYIYRVVNFDSETHTWDGGDYDTGNIIPKDDLMVKILEEDVDIQAGMVITQSYPYFSQLNIIASAVQKLAEASGLECEEVEELNNMLTFIEARKEVNARFKEAYKEDDSFKFMTRRDVWDETARQLDGGLHEEYGPAGTVLPHLDPLNDADQPGYHH